MPMIKTSMYVLGSASLLALGLASAAFAQSSVTTDVGTLDRETAEKVQPRQPYSPPAGRNFPSRPFFGDTHLHTSFSMDAGAFGARLAPRDAYHFAKGEEVMASSGQPAKLARPLDFLVVADHSDAMGFFPQLFAGKPEMLADPTGRRWYNLIQSGRGAEAAIEIIGSFSQGTFPKAILPLPGTPTFRSACRKRLRRRTRRTIPGASPPLSATSGPRTQVATTCTATWSSATTA